MLWLSLLTLFASAYHLQCQVLFQLELNPGIDTSNGVYWAGKLNRWNPHDSAYRFKAGELILNLNEEQEIEFKLTGGSWSKAEATAVGAFRSNRNLTVRPGDTIKLFLKAWERHAQTQKLSPRVHALNDSIFLPKLERYCRVWVYLPKSYPHFPNKRYPVLYLHDGQNLFKGLEGSPEKWQVDDLLDSLDAELMVIALEHGEASRINEYSVWPHPEYGGGEGKLFAEDLMEVVIPLVDSLYRTHSSYEYRYLGGSSLGALSSLYIGLKYPQQFSKFLVFSPAIWFNTQIVDQVEDASVGPKHHFYFLAGGKENIAAPLSVLKDVNLIASKLRQKHVRVSIRYCVNAKHHESFWRQNFIEALKNLSILP